MQKMSITDSWRSGLSRHILGLVAAGVILVPSAADAHTVQVCWRDSGGVTTFHAGTYHSPLEGPSPVGKIILDGFGYRAGALL